MKPLPPRDAKGRFCRKPAPPLDPKLVAELGKDRRAVALTLDELPSWQFVIEQIWTYTKGYLDLSFPGL